MALARKTILIASILKPINDTRMYEKMAYSLLEIEGLSIHIAGRAAEEPNSYDGRVTFHSIFNGNRLGFERIKAIGRFITLLLKVKPQVLVVNSPELLIVSVLSKIFFGFRLIYDVRENYSLNYLHAKTIKKPFNWLIAFAWKGIETLATYYCNEIFLAELCYQKELSWAKRGIVLQNKVSPIYQAYINSCESTPKPIRIKGFNFLYSGTISEHYGIWEAIQFIEEFVKIHPEATLTIAGYAAQKDVQSQLLELSKTRAHIRLVGITKLIPHKEVMAHIETADILILPYQTNLATKNRIPTKYFEGLLMLKPLLLSDSFSKLSLFSNNLTGLSFNFSNINAKEVCVITNALLSEAFYYESPLPYCLWLEEGVLLNSIVVKHIEC